MPEGHTTHRLAAAHQRHYAGSLVGVSSPQGCFAAAAAKLNGRVLERAEAHGKHLFHVCDPDLIVHVHLRPLRLLHRGRVARGAASRSSSHAAGRRYALDQSAGTGRV